VHERARRLAEELDVESLTGSARALADQAVTILRRLEELDAVLEGRADAWLGIQTRLGSDIAEVTVNGPLAEERQQALAFRAVVGELAKLTGQEKPAVPVDVADELARKRDEQRKAAGIG
jgi:hypothetical protein